MILKKVEQTIEKFNLLKENDRIVVALSGGPDSVAMLYLLNKLKKKRRLYLHIAHLNHLLRDEEANQDALFVKELAGKLKTPLASQSIKVKDFAKEMKLSLEEAGRRLRYDFLLSVAKEVQADKIALGHNQDDQAETVLMRLLRGSGVSGLRGIPATRKLNNCLIIRPLIELRRCEILSFLSKKHIAFRTDSSNSENLYFRNKIRNKLIPLLEKNFNPRIKEVLVNLAENLTCDFDFLEKAGIKGLKTVRTSSNNHGLSINLKKYSGLHKAMQKLVNRLAIKELKGDVRRIDYRHWKEVEDLVVKRPKDSIVDLPGGISVMKTKENLIFYARDLK